MILNTSRNTIVDPWFPHHWAPARQPEVITPAVRRSAAALLTSALDGLAVDEGTHDALDPSIAAFIAQLEQQTSAPAVRRRKAAGRLIASTEARAVRLHAALLRSEQHRVTLARVEGELRTALTGCSALGATTARTVDDVRGAFLDGHRIRTTSPSRPVSTTAELLPTLSRTESDTPTTEGTSER